MMKYNGYCRQRMGFNVIELVVVSLVVFILLGLVLAVLKIQRDNQRIVVNLSSIKHLALANHSCNDVHRRLPPAFDKFDKILFPASVHVHLMPYIEQDKLYNVILQSNGQRGTSEVVITFLGEQDFRVGTNDAAGVQNFAANLRVFSDKGVETPFDGNMPALGAIEPGTAAIPRTFQDGTSNTIVFATKLAQCGNGGSHYAAAADSPFAAFFGQNAAQVKAHPSAKNATYQLNPSVCHTTPLMAQSFTGHGLSVGLADGSVYMINPAVSPRTWNQLVQPNDGMNVENDWLP